MPAVICPTGRFCPTAQETLKQKGPRKGYRRGLLQRCRVPRPLRSAVAPSSQASRRRSAPEYARRVFGESEAIRTVEPMPVEYHAGMLAEILQGWGMLPVGSRVVLPDGERVLLSQVGGRRVLHQQN